MSEELVIKTKRCSKCGLVKPIEEFYRNRGHTDGLSGLCKQCMKQYNLRHVEERRVYRWKYYKRNDIRDKRTEYNRIYLRSYYRGHQEEFRAYGRDFIKRHRRFCRRFGRVNMHNRRHDIPSPHYKLETWKDGRRVLTGRQANGRFIALEYYPEGGRVNGH